MPALELGNTVLQMPAVPKVAVTEDGNVGGREHDVRTAGQALGVGRKPKALTLQGGSQNLLAAGAALPAGCPRSFARFPRRRTQPGVTWCLALHVGILDHCLGSRACAKALPGSGVCGVLPNELAILRSNREHFLRWRSR